MTVTIVMIGISIPGNPIVTARILLTWHMTADSASAVMPPRMVI